MFFIDYDLEMFPELDMKRFMTTVWETEDGTIHIVPIEWARGLHKYGLLSLMDMPHFGLIVEVNTCVKQLLVYFHGGCLWINKKISVDVDLKAWIVGLPLTGVDPTPFSTGKDQDTTLTNRMKEKYNLSRDKRGFSIASINGIFYRFTPKVLSRNMLRNMRPN